MKQIIKSLLLLIVTILILPRCSDNPQNDKLKQQIQISDYSLSYLDNLYERKNLKIQDRTIENYINSNPNIPDSIRNVIYLLPLGHMSSEIEEIINEEINYLKSFFQLDVKIMTRVSFDDLKKIEQIKTRNITNNSGGKFNEKFSEQLTTEQIEANSLIDNYIIPNKPDDAIAILGVTDHDIYSGNYSFIYGTSNRKSGTGLISTHRLKEYPELAKSNIRKAISKQIANLFSIRNVKDYVCVLNFHNNIYELESGVFYISPRALEKLKISIGFDYKDRFTDLKEHWRKEQNTEMVNFYNKCLSLDSITKK